MARPRLELLARHVAVLFIEDHLSGFVNPSEVACHAVGLCEGGRNLSSLSCIAREYLIVWGAQAAGLQRLAARRTHIVFGGPPKTARDPRALPSHRFSWGRICRLAAEYTRPSSAVVRS